MVEAPIGTEIGAESCSMIAVIARPEDFDGKLLLVVGYATFGFEADRLFTSAEDAHVRVPKNSIQLDGLPAGMKWRDSYVSVVGVFEATPGNSALLVSGILRVKGVAPWPARSK